MAVLDKGLLAKLYRKIVHKFYINDLWLDLCVVAKKESVDYIVANMAKARILRDRFDLLKFAVSQARDTGLFLEFGVEKGASIRLLAGETDRIVDGFDSFQGLPVDWRGTKEGKGKFDLKGVLPRVPSNVRLHVGWFDQTIATFLKDNKETVAFLHVDCDVYESTKVVFDQLGDRITSGTVIVFDEYLNYPGWRQHEIKAFREFIQQHKLRYTYIGLSAEKGHVAVRID